MELADLGTWIEAQEAQFTQTLATLVNLNTFTANTDGVDAGMKIIVALAESMGFHCEAIHGRHRLIKAGNGQGKRILLISHMDTVHPPDGDFQHYEPQADGFVRGPGIGDMKGGLVMGLWTQLALSQLIPNFDVQLIISADEETGSNSLRDWYLTNGGGAELAIGLEPGFPQGKLTPEVTMGVVKERKGSGRILFSLKGRASHAGGAWQDGLSAIQAMADKITQIHALTNADKGITTNVGLVQGGTAANTIAEHCSAEVDYRFLTQADADTIFAAIQTITQTPSVHNPVLNISDCVDKFEQTVYLPPMEYTPQSHTLIETVLEQAQHLRQTVIPIARGGGSDANYISGAGVPAICGMGAPAEGIHTTQERIHLPLLFRRLELLIRTVYHLV